MIKFALKKISILGQILFFINFSIIIEIIMYFKNQMIKKIKIFNQKLNLNLSSKVFEPNLTTWSIVEACHKIKFNKKKILDLGSGSGVIGIFLKKKFKKK